MNIQHLIASVILTLLICGDHKETGVSIVLMIILIGSLITIVGPLLYH